MLIVSHINGKLSPRPFEIIWLSIGLSWKIKYVLSQFHSKNGDRLPETGVPFLLCKPDVAYFSLAGSLTLQYKRSEALRKPSEAPGA